MPSTFLAAASVLFDMVASAVVGRSGLLIIAMAGCWHNIRELMMANGAMKAIDAVSSLRMIKVRSNCSAVHLRDSHWIVVIAVASENRSGSNKVAKSIWRPYFSS